MTDQLSLAAEFEPATLDQWRRLALGVLRKSGAAALMGARQALGRKETPPEAVDELLPPRPTTGSGSRPLLRAHARDRDRRDRGLGRPAAPQRARPGGAPQRDPGRPRGRRDLDLARPARRRLGRGRPGRSRRRPVEDPRRVLPRSGRHRARRRAGRGRRGGHRAAADRRRPRHRRPPATSGSTRTGGPPSVAHGGADPTLPGGGVGPPVRDRARGHAGDHGRRDALPRRGRQRRAGARRRARHRRRLPAGADRRRPAIDAALGQLEFRYAATADQFATIAKLRAARRLWARVAEVCGAPAPAAQRQHAVTSAAMMTARDPWVNMLRTTRRLLRRRGRRRRRGHRAAVRRARSGLPDALRPADRPQHPVAAAARRRASAGSSTRPAAPGTSSAHRRPGPRGLGRGSRRSSAPAGSRAALRGGLVARPARRDLASAAPTTRPPPRPDHRGQRVPQPRRASVPARATRARRDRRRRPAAAPVRRGASRRCATAADAHAAATGARPGSSWRRSARPAAHAARVAFAANLFAGRRHRDRRSAPTDGRSPRPRRRRASACARPRQAVRRAAPSRWPPALRAAGAAHVWLAGRPGDYDGRRRVPLRRLRRRRRAPPTL